MSNYISKYNTRIEGLVKLARKFTVGIVGGAGYIGRNLAKVFSEKGCSVRILDVNSPLSGLAGVEYVEADVRDYERVRRGLEGVDVVVHSAIIQIPKINECKRLAYEVNILGTQNVCRAVEEIDSIKGLLLTSTWHTMGEFGVKGLIDESYGYHPDKVEPRARLYALSKVVQEGIVRYYDEMSKKIYGAIRLGTVLGEGMPAKTAANIFISNGLSGKPITPYKHSMYRPMLYVDIRDVCRAFEVYAEKIVSGEIKKSDNSLDHIFNLVYPEPITIYDLAITVKELIRELTGGRIDPPVEVIDKGLPSKYEKDDAKKINVDLSRARKILGMEKLISPRESLRFIIEGRLKKLIH